MATFCMQTLGCEVSAIHTVNYSNHVGYRRFKGRRSTPEEVAELYQGLQDANLHDFDMMLSGYCPSAALVEQVGKIARDIKHRAATKPGSFFWVLDPVMGDNGRIYVAEDSVPAYKHILRDADLILPNQFEAELLSDVKIHDLATMEQAITKLHRDYQIPHVLITSIRLPPTAIGTPDTGADEASSSPSSSVAKLSVIGSTATSDAKPRLFRIAVPALPVFFSGTGDMFAALIAARLREAARAADLLATPSWRSPDAVVAGPDLPLAKATALVLAGMHAVLKDTARHYEAVAESLTPKEGEGEGEGGGGEAEETARHLKLTRAAEVRVVRNAAALRNPPDRERFRAEAVLLDS